MSYLDTSKVGRWIDQPDEFDPMWGEDVFDDFTGNSASISPSGFQAGVSGAGAAITVLASPGARNPGMWRLDTGTTTTGRSGCNRSVTSYIAGGGILKAWVSFRINQLSTVTDEFFFHDGWGDALGADNTDSAGAFYYDRVNYGNYLVIGTASNSSRTKKVMDGTLDNPTVTITAGDKFLGYMETDATGSQTEFWVSQNGGAYVYLGKVTTNIPTSAGREFGQLCNIRKTAGTTSVTADKDMWRHRIRFSSPRGAA